MAVWSSRCEDGGGGTRMICVCLGSCCCRLLCTEWFCWPLRFCCVFYCCRVACPWNGWLRRLCSTGSTRTRAMCEFAQTGRRMPTVHSCGAAAQRKNPGVEISWLSALASNARVCACEYGIAAFPSPARCHLRRLDNPELLVYQRLHIPRRVCSLISIR